VVLAACGANRKVAADGMRAMNRGGAVGWRATRSALRGLGFVDSSRHGITDGP
jgi:hypothetical protein